MKTDTSALLRTLPCSTINSQDIVYTHQQLMAAWPLYAKFCAVSQPHGHRLLTAIEALPDLQDLSSGIIYEKPPEAPFTDSTPH